MKHLSIPCRLLCVVPLCGTLATLAASTAAQIGRAAEPVDFNRDIRPILSDNCYACHGPDEQTRQGSAENGLRLDTKAGAFAPLEDGHVIVPSQPDDSQLIQRVFSTDADFVMPPVDHHKQLSDQQKQSLREWIAQGAEWSEHWAYAPPVRHEPPGVNATDRVRNWIDQFILARLEAEGLAPSPPADRRTLIRRLSFDLTGLPPAPDEVDAFVNDASDDAWASLVNRLLDSPHYGERMAMHWLDLVRYADSVGYHGDQPVSVSPFRDYVIRSFNQNKPFDQFTREQLAGDLLPEPTQEQLVASGYNKLGMMSAEGGVQDKEYLAKYAADRVRTASTIWMGTTLGCAECHDHKFDPLTTRDFYRFAAFFADIKERGLYAGAFADGKWGPTVTIEDEVLPELLKPIDDRLGTLEQITTTHTPELADAQAEWEREPLASLTDWRPLQPHTAAALHGTELAVLDDNSILASGPIGETNTYTIQTATTLEGVTGFRVEVLPHESLPNNGPGRANGNFVLTELTIEAGSPQGGEADAPKVALQHAKADFESVIAAEQNPYKKWGAEAVIDGDAKGVNWGWSVAPQEGRSHQLVVETAQPLNVASGGQPLPLTIRLDQNLGILPNFNLGRFRLWATTDPQPVKIDTLLTLPDNIRAALTTPAAERTRQQADELEAYYRSITPLLDPARKEIADLRLKRNEIVAAHSRTSLITVAVEPREMRVLPRGNWMDDSGEVVEPGVPGFLPQLSTADRATRLDLADWLVSADNPLCARVFVNRLWKMYFGAGLSKVLDDVGAQGESPVYPKLLDTLAVEFMQSGWDVRHIVELMVMSGTYRQSSLPRDDLAERDPYNRLLARQSRWRLDAELIRDNALQVSGLLVTRVGGRSAKPYQPVGLYRHLNFPKRTYSADTGEDQYRRGLYTHWQRQFLHPALLCFDAPTREEATAERARSNTPLAALNLLNDPSYTEAARTLAGRALQDGGAADPKRIDWIMQQALNREAQEDELTVLRQLLTVQRERFAQDPQAARDFVAIGQSPPPEEVDAPELAAWTAVARAVCNMHEFITRN